MLRATVPRILLCVSASIIPSLLTLPPFISHFFCGECGEKATDNAKFCFNCFHLSQSLYHLTNIRLCYYGTPRILETKRNGPVAGRIVSANHLLRISSILGVKMV